MSMAFVLEASAASGDGREGVSEHSKPNVLWPVSYPTLHLEVRRDVHVTNQHMKPLVTIHRPFGHLSRQHVG